LIPESKRNYILTLQIQRPMNIDLHSKKNKNAVQSLLAYPPMLRLILFGMCKLVTVPNNTFANNRSLAVFSTWAPLLKDHYMEMVAALMATDTSLVLPFAVSIFTAIAINFGPKTVCLGHRDRGNLSYGWCAVTGFGKYDYRKGGHLILWDLKLVVEMPPGCTVFLPSAIIKHSNTSIGPDETRYSIAQYTAGGLFRWVARGFQPEYKYEEECSDEEWDAEVKRRASRFEAGLNLFSTLSQLQEYHENRN